jgi:hypothetical protein
MRTYLGLYTGRTLLADKEETHPRKITQDIMTDFLIIFATIIKGLGLKLD